MREKRTLDVEIGERIRHYRSLSHITQAQLAEKLSRSTNHISDIERGLSGISPAMILELCDIFNISADDLLRGETTASVPLEDRLQLICEKMASVTPEAIPPLQKIIDAYLEVVESLKK